MKKLPLVLLVLIHFSCKKLSEVNIDEYYNLTHQAELSICFGNYEKASKEYIEAFKKIRKPFGNDLFNAALVNQLVQNVELRDEYLIILINNLDDLSVIEDTFLGRYLNKDSYDKLVSMRIIDYDTKLREEFKEIEKRDQLFRPMYESHDDTINANRIINLNRIISLSESIGFPSHIELGFTESLLGQKHDIVLLHTAQRRSTDKDILDLEPILYNAVNEGRLDPEKAIFFISMQNDTIKGNYEVYSTWQLQHHLLPDSLNTKIWLRNLDSAQIIEANRIRNIFHADKLEDIALKASFKATTDLPFIFSSVRTSESHFRSDFTLEKALDQYKIATSIMKPYKINTNHN